MMDFSWRGGGGGGGEGGKCARMLFGNSHEFSACVCHFIIIPHFSVVCVCRVAMWKKKMARDFQSEDFFYEFSFFFMKRENEKSLFLFFFLGKGGGEEEGNFFLQVKVLCVCVCSKKKVSAGKMVKKKNE